MSDLDREQLLQAVVETLRGPCGVKGAIAGESTLMEELGLGSMGMLALAVELENRFRVKLGEEPEHPPETVNELVHLLEMRLNERA